MNYVNLHFRFENTCSRPVRPRLLTRALCFQIVMVDYVKPDFRFENGSFDPILEEPIKELMLANSYVLANKLDTDLIFVKNTSEYFTPKVFD